ncbi:MAG: hypothetical protein DWQ01_05220 [Planctomycetota bacterium]|nr:MAG: hypothetical protein DWQ01_05220 [Planctomycetota bacterium]
MKLDKRLLWLLPVLMVAVVGFVSLNLKEEQTASGVEESLQKKGNPFEAEESEERMFHGAERAEIAGEESKSSIDLRLAYFQKIYDEARTPTDRGSILILNDLELWYEDAEVWEFVREASLESLPEVQLERANYHWRESTVERERAAFQGLTKELSHKIQWLDGFDADAFLVDYPEALPLMNNHLRRLKRNEALLGPEVAPLGPDYRKKVMAAPHQHSPETVLKAVSSSDREQPFSGGQRVEAAREFQKFVVQLTRLEAEQNDREMAVNQVAKSLGLVPIGPDSLEELWPEFAQVEDQRRQLIKAYCDQIRLLGDG